MLYFIFLSYYYQILLREDIYYVIHYVKFKKILILNVFFVLLIATSGCNTDTADTTEEEQIVQMQVIDTYYKAPYNTIIGSVP